MKRVASGNERNMTVVKCEVRRATRAHQGEDQRGPLDGSVPADLHISAIAMHSLMAWTVR